MSTIKMKAVVLGAGEGDYEIEDSRGIYIRLR